VLIVHPCDRSTATVELDLARRLSPSGRDRATRLACQIFPLAGWGVGDAGESYCYVRNVPTRVLAAVVDDLLNLPSVEKGSHV
jgi:hypothetical protein